MGNYFSIKRMKAIAILRELVCSGVNLDWIRLLLARLLNLETEPP